MYNGIQQNCMAFPMMGPDLPDHHLYHGHYPTRTTVNSFCSTSCSRSYCPISFFLFHALHVVKGKKIFCFCFRLRLLLSSSLNAKECEIKKELPTHLKSENLIIMEYAKSHVSHCNLRDSISKFE